MRAQNDELEFYSARCRELEAHVHDLKAKLASSLPDNSSSETSENNGSSIEVQSHKGELTLKRAQVQILKTLADERSQKLAESTLALESHPWLEDALSESKKENRDLDERVTDLIASNVSLTNKSQNLEEQNHMLQREIKQLRESKTFRTGRALAASTTSFLAFIRTPKILNQIRKEPTAVPEKHNHDTNNV